MKAIQGKMFGLALGAFMLAGAACDDEEGCSVDPLGEIRLSNGTEEVVHAAGSYHTFALGMNALGGLIYDVSGSHQIDFFLNDGKTHHQELMVFDLFWDEPIVAFDPFAHYYPVPGVHYKTVPAGHSVSYTLGPSMLGTGHVIRQYRGWCRISIPWQDIFGPLSDEFLAGLVEDAGVDIAQRIGENMQASYVGRNADIRHGFAWEGLYTLKVGGIWHTDLGLNAGYSLTPREADGLVSVTNLHARTDAFGGIQAVAGPVETSIRSALQTTIPEGIEKALTDRAKFAIPFSQNTCGAGDPLEEQQDACYDFAIDDDTAYNLFVAVLTQAGLAENGWNVEYIASMMVSGLQPKNFSCLDDPTSSGQCAFHPVVQNVNIRPTELELVVSGSNSSIATLQELNFLYGVGMPILLDQLGGSGDIVTCGDPLTSPTSGTLPLFSQPPKTLP